MPPRPVRLEHQLCGKFEGGLTEIHCTILTFRITDNTTAKGNGASVIAICVALFIFRTILKDNNKCFGQRREKCHVFSLLNRTSYMYMS